MFSLHLIFLNTEHDMCLKMVIYQSCFFLISIQINTTQKPCSLTKTRERKENKIGHYILDCKSGDLKKIKIKK